MNPAQPVWWQRLLAADFAAPWRAAGQAALALLLGACLAWALGAALPLDQALAQRLDLQLRLAAPPPPPDAAVVVDIDEPSLQRLGAWPWPRDRHLPVAAWLQAAGAKAVAFNLLMVDPRAGDEAWWAWVSSTPMPVLLAARGADLPVSSASASLGRSPVAGLPPGCSADPVGAWRLPLWLAGPSEAASAASADWPQRRVGAQSLPMDDGPLLRRWALWQQADGLALPMLPMAAWRALHPQASGLAACVGAAGQTRADAALFWPGKRVWPVLSDHLPDTLSFGQLMDAADNRLDAATARALTERVRGRVVFIGSSAVGGEQVATPWGYRDGTSLMAATHDALAHGRLLAAPRPAVDGSLLALSLALPLGVGCWRRRPRLPSELGWLAASAALLLLVDAALVAGSAQSSQLVLPLSVLLAWGGLAWWTWRARQLDEHRRLVLARAAADAANLAKGEFLAHVSHEVRTPLNALLGAAELLAQTPLDAQQARHVALFQSAGQELLQMLNDLLDLSKIEAGLLTLDRAPFSLTRLVAGQVMLFEARAQQKGLQLLVEAEPDLPEVVVGDGPRLAQVLRNLLSNAVKFTSVGSVTLHVGRAADGKQLRFEVSDTGIGVAPERVEAIFAPFTQADANVGRQYGGTGLGLAICRRLVQAMGGQIGLSSKPGLGSHFHVEVALPATSAVPAREAGAPRSSRLPAGTPALLPSRILVVDDNPLNTLLVQAYLAEGAHLIDVVHDGAAALRRFEAEPYPLVLMDLQMPVMDGMAAVAAMRALEQRRQRPPAWIVALSGQVDAQTAAAALAAGFNAHLGKPCSRAQLLSALAQGQVPAHSRPAGLSSGHSGPVSGLPSRAPSSHPASASAPAFAPSGPRLRAISRLPDADLPTAVARLGGEPLYDRVLSAAAEPLRHFEARLAQALDNVPCDLRLAHRLAHDLKSVAATLGLSGLAADARWLEQALADTVTPTEDRQIAQARAAVAERLRVLRDALARADGGV